jgi:hypothetical protein
MTSKDFPGIISCPTKESGWAVSLLSTPSAEDVYGDSRIISYEREVGEDKEGDGNAPADLPRLQNMLHKNRRTYCVCRDTRTAFDELPSNLKEQLLKNDHIADNSTWYFLQLAVLDLLDLLDLLDFLAHINPPRITRWADIASCSAAEPRAG